MNAPTLHDFERKLVLNRAKIERSSMCAANKQTLREFEQHCVAEGLSPARRWKLLEYLYVLGTRYLTTPFSEATSREIWNAVLAVEAAPYAPWTKHDFKVAVKKLFKFLAWGTSGLSRQGYPKSVAMISTRIRKRDQVRIQAADILSEAEVDRLIAASSDTQARAMLSLMYELGARVSEIGTLRVGSVTRDEYGYVFDLNGKTGPRSVRVIRSAGVVTAWLNQHPCGSDPQAPLWGSMATGSWTRWAYQAILSKVRRTAARAGISKRVHPHLLRHSRITHVLAAGMLNEAQAKVFFGLSTDSDKLAVYSHLISRDANDAVLRMHGIERSRSTVAQPIQSCGMCRQANATGTRFCSSCGYPMDVHAPEAAAGRIESAGENVERFLSDPRIDALFREMVRREVDAALARALPEPPAPPAAPTRGRPRQRLQDAA